MIKDIELTGFDNVFKFFSSSKEESVYVLIPLDHLQEFKGHPFRVEDNKDMAELVKSVKEHGILNPGIAREISDGQYEIMVDSNLQREDILPSEKAWAYRIQTVLRW